MARCDLITPPWYRRTSQLQLFVQNFCSAAPVPVSPCRVAFRSIAVAPSLVGSICTHPTSCLSLSFPIPTVSNIYHISLPGFISHLSFVCLLRIEAIDFEACPSSHSALSPAGPLERLLDVRLDVLYSRAYFACVKFLLFVIYFDWDTINIASPCS
jgi:hypothetical protein